jgi:protein TonB
MAAQRSAFPRPARGPPRLREGAAPVRDRLLATLFLVALLHGIVILGLTFGGSGRPGGLAPGLEVLLVSDEVPTADRNDSAAYLAQRTQLGSGTAIDARSPRSPRAANGVVADRGDGPADAAHPRGANDADSDERIIASSAQRLVVRLFSDQGTESGAPEELRLASRDLGPDDVERVELRGEKRAELLVTADTRESVVAPYLDAWRGKVERIGTLNYPTAARRAGLVANPTLEVTIAADGRLAAATVRTSSGFPELDQAAIDILKLASPFDPFPSDLAARYATLRFAYEWQFVAGQVERGTVTAPVDSP